MSRYGDVMMREVTAPFLLISAVDGAEWPDSRPGRFTTGERAPSNHWISGLVGSKIDLDVVE